MPPIDETLTDQVRAWGAPDWIVDGLAAYLRAGGKLDRDLWLDLMAAAHDEAAEPAGWNPSARAASLASRQERQADHDAAVVKAIREARAAGMSWRKTADALGAAGLPPPRPVSQAGEVVRWEHPQVTRIARRHGIE